MNEDCIFCKIANKEMPASIEYEDTQTIAFWDINPKAPIHILIIPKKHIPSIADLKPGDDEEVAKMIMIAKKIAEDKGIAHSGYKLIFNVRDHGGQIIDHLHLHLLGGEPITGIV